MSINRCPLLKEIQSYLDRDIEYLEWLISGADGTEITEKDIEIAKENVAHWTNLIHCAECV